LRCLFNLDNKMRLSSANLDFNKNVYSRSCLLNGEPVLEWTLGTWQETLANLSNRRHSEGMYLGMAVVVQEWPEVT
jgi:hypothetical protein